MTITITEEDPLQDDIRSLITELNEALHALTPPEHCFHMTADEIVRPDSGFSIFYAKQLTTIPHEVGA